MVKRKRFVFHPWIIMVVVAYSCGSSVSAQVFTINHDLQQINIAMFEAKNLYMETDYTLYFDQTVKSQMKGIIKRNDRSLFQRVGDMTSIKNEKYSVFIHEGQKMIVVDPHEELNDPIKREDLLRINIDTLKHMLLGTELTSRGDTKTIIFTLKKGEYSRIIIQYDANTYFLKSMELYTRDLYTATDKNQYKVWMQVLFVLTKTDVSFGKEEFSEKKYVNIESKNKVKQTTTYQSYKLINNLNKTIRYE